LFSAQEEGSMNAKRLAFALVTASWTVAAWAQGLPAAAPESVGMSAPRLARISDAFRKEIDEGKLPGAVLLVARKGKLVYADAVGFQDKEAGKPIARDSIFRIYSMTKPIVSVAAMMLVEDGRIQLTDPVSKFLPAMKGMYVSVAKTDAEFARITYTQLAAEREMTVQDLLRHTAGLAYGEITQNMAVKEALGKAGLYKSAIDYDTRDLAPAEEVERLAKVPLAHQPGTVWEYSLASDVLGRVVEAASGERFGRLPRQTPVQAAEDGRHRLPGAAGQDRPACQAVAHRPYQRQAEQFNRRIGGASERFRRRRRRFHRGGLPAVCPDVLNGGQLDGNRILSRSTVALMTSDHLGTRISAPTTPGELLLGVPGYTFGLGFAVRQGPGVAGVPGSAGEFMWAAMPARISGSIRRKKSLRST
jgi:CubicO group peptidase (beta-lactamase class C family)